MSCEYCDDACCDCDTQPSGLTDQASRAFVDAARRAANMARAYDKEREANMELRKKVAELELREKRLMTLCHELSFRIDQLVLAKIPSCRD